MRRHADLLAVSAFAIVAAVVVLAVPVTAIKVAFALPLCLATPGHAVVEAAFARHTLTGALRLLLTAAMSLCVLILGALVLNELREGIRDVTWAVSMAVVVVACCAIAGVRRVRPPVPLRIPVVPAPRYADTVVVLVAIAVLATAAMVSRTPTAAKVVGYTQLWLLPTEAPEARQLTVGIRSAELGERGYRLEVEFPGRERRLVIPGIRLAPGAEYRRVITLPAKSRDATVLLFRAGEDRVHRRVDTGTMRQRPAR